MVTYVPYSHYKPEYSSLYYVDLAHENETWTDRDVWT
jgi:hypothetical protein